MVATKKKPKARLSAFTVEPQVVIDNTLSDALTVIEINGLDRPGLLYDVTREISDLNLDIASAHIATFGEKAVDVFYVTDLTGKKITSSSRESIDPRPPDHDGALLRRSRESVKAHARAATALGMTHSPFDGERAASG